MLTKILRKIAAHSPAAFAGKIEKRFQWALNSLKVLRETGGTMSRSYACPHCTCCCDLCVYTQVTSDESIYRCANIAFNGITLSYIWRHYYVKVNLGINCIAVEINKDDLDCKELRQRYEREYRRCIKFCEGHVEWARKAKWGSAIRGRSD